VKIHCEDCDWVGEDLAILSSSDDGYGARGTCPNCGSDENGFAEASPLEVANWEAKSPNEYFV
jgi:Zn finger protein HypA/HybF involved in hydrogenase expression